MKLHIKLITDCWYHTLIKKKAKFYFIIILTVYASDADEGTNGEVRYGITGPGTEIFAIDAHTGWITTLIPLDRETTPNYKLNIVATDGGTPPKSNNVTIYVNLVDDNDNPPTFTQESYTASGIITAIVALFKILIFIY